MSLTVNQSSSGNSSDSRSPAAPRPTEAYPKTPPAHAEPEATPACVVSLSPDAQRFLLQQHLEGPVPAVSAAGASRPTAH